MNAGTAVLEIFLLIVGFALLVKGADFFVDGASGIAKKLKVSTFIIGVTVVALGTSAPELAVTIVDSVSGEGDLIVGNVLGSNVMNILLILGISAIVCNLPVERSTRLIDMPFLIITSIFFVVFGFLGSSFTWWEGLILLLCYIGFMVYNVILATKQSKAGLEQASATAVAEEKEIEVNGWRDRLKVGYENLQNKTWFLIVITIVGLGMVVGGAELVVTYAQDLAINLLGISPEIVALTVVAFGTSLPELVTSVSAAKKGDVGIATGNIIGSNIANILLIGGVGAICSVGNGGLPFGTEALISGFVALGAAALIFAFAWSKSKSIGRVAGIIFLICLVAYYAFIFLNYFIFKLY